MLKLICQYKAVRSRKCSFKVRLVVRAKHKHLLQGRCLCLMYYIDMKITSEEERAWLDILESLYLLRLKYPNDEFINKEVSSIAFQIGENLESPIRGFTELAEMPYVDSIDPELEKPNDHYYEVVRESLKRLSELQKND